MKNEENHTNQELANKINEAFNMVMNDYMPLPDDVLSPLMTTGWPLYYSNGGIRGTERKTDQHCKSKWT